MNIGIIGSGEMGSCLASGLARLGHQVSIANSRGPASIRDYAAELGAAAVPIEEVTNNRDVVIISIHEKNVGQLPAGLFIDLPEDSVVIDTGNYYPNLRGGFIPALDQTGIDSLWVQNQIGFPVVKVFNAILATSIQTLGKPHGDKDRIAIPVSGDDKKAKEIVYKLVDDLGFDCFDVGTIAQSWKQQPGSPIYCRDLPISRMKKRFERLNAGRPDMLSMIIEKRKADEILMQTDYSSYLKQLSL